MAAAALVGFAVVSTGTGLVLALGDGSATIQRLGFVLYAAGAPISGLFAAIAGDLPLAPFTDIVVWLVLAGLAARLTDRRTVTLGQVLGSIIGLALVFGLVVSFLIERA